MSVRDDQLDTLKVDGKDYEYYRIADLPGIDHLPYSLKVLVENLVRNIDGANITDDHVKALLDWDPAAQPSHEIQFTPSRVVMQDFTGVPCIVDLATMRDAVKDLGGDPEVINPQVQSDMVIDHSVQIDKYASRRGRTEHGHRIPAQRRTLPVPALGSAGIQELPRGTAGNGHHPPGQYRISRQGHHTKVEENGARLLPILIPAWAPTRTPPPSMAWACSVGALAALKPKRPCLDSRSPCWCRVLSVSSLPVPFLKASPPPTWC